MKQVLLVLGVFALCSFPLSVQATETQVAPIENRQEVEVENAGAVLLFQKQPVYEKQLQLIRVKKSGAVTIFQWNGKVKESKSDEKVVE
jgi:hypothetical protein